LHDLRLFAAAEGEKNQNNPMSAVRSVAEEENFWEDLLEELSAF